MAADQLQEGTCSNYGTSAAATGSISPAPHALLLPFPAQGHINPLMQLGQRLLAHGVHVTLAIADHFHARIMSSHTRSHSSNHGIQIVDLKDGLPPDFDRKIWDVDLQNTIDNELLESALELVHRLASQGCPVTCIISSFALRWPSSLAERVAVPEFIFWSQCASVFSMYLHVDAIISEGYDPFEANVPATASRETPMELITCISGLPMGIHPADLPWEYQYIGKPGLEWMRAMLSDFFKRMGSAEGVIGNSFEALEPEVFKALTLEFQKALPHTRYENCWPKSIRLVGPLLPVADARAGGRAVSGASLWREEVEECTEWLDLQPAASVLFVAFGSILSLTVAQVQELAMGLADSGQRFLWVIRENAIKGNDNEKRPGEEGSLANVEDVLPWGFVEQNKHKCKLVRWAPQAMVLAHPSVGGFFSHCGWNSTLESVCSGVPVLGWPWYLDQVTNSWLTSHVWRVGLTLERNEANEASRSQVESGVRQLMEGAAASSLRTRARELRDVARQALLRNDSFLSFVNDIRNLAL